MEASLRNKHTVESAGQEGEILSPAKLGWRRFKRDKIGMIGTVMVILLLCHGPVWPLLFTL